MNCFILLLNMSLNANKTLTLLSETLADRSYIQQNSHILRISRKIRTWRHVLSNKLAIHLEQNKLKSQSITNSIRKINSTAKLREIKLNRIVSTLQETSTSSQRSA